MCYLLDSGVVVSFWIWAGRLIFELLLQKCSIAASRWHFKGVFFLAALSAVPGQHGALHSTCAALRDTYIIFLGGLRATSFLPSLYPFSFTQQNMDSGVLGRSIVFYPVFFLCFFSDFLWRNGGASETTVEGACTTWLFVQRSPSMPVCCDVYRFLTPRTTCSPALHPAFSQLCVPVASSCFDFALLSAFLLFVFLFLGTGRDTIWDTTG